MLRIEARKEEHTLLTILKGWSLIFRECDPGALCGPIADVAPFLGKPRMHAGCGERAGNEACSAQCPSASGLG